MSRLSRKQILRSLKKTPQIWTSDMNFQLGLLLCPQVIFGGHKNYQIDSIFFDEYQTNFENQDSL